MAKVYLGLGTNLGDKEQNLRDAVQKIEEQVGKMVSLSASGIPLPVSCTRISTVSARSSAETRTAPPSLL